MELKSTIIVLAVCILSPRISYSRPHVSTAEHGSISRNTQAIPTTRVSYRTNVFAPRGTTQSNSGQGNHGNRTLPHCSECFGHGVNASKDDLCDLGCTGFDRSTGLPRSAPSGTGVLKTEFPIKTAPSPGFGKGLRQFRKSIRGSIQTTRWRQSGLATPTTKVLIHNYSTTGAGKFGKMMAPTLGGKPTASGNEVILSSTQRFQTATGIVTLKQTHHTRLKEQEKKAEENLLPAYRKYLTASIIVLLAAVCGVVVIIGVVSYLKHRKRKRKVHSFKDLVLA